MRSTVFAALYALGVIACASPTVSEPAPTPVPTYYADVAPIIDSACGGCHRDGGSGPFSLATFDEVAEQSGTIARVTGERIMPPWPADSSGACGTFVGQRWLDDEAIAVLAAWHAAGAPAGDPVDAIVVPPPTPMRFVEAVSLVADAPYEVRPGPDEYRCFVVDPGLDADRFITAVGVDLDRAEVVHHIQLFASDDDATDSALGTLAAADAAPGYACGEDGLGADVRYVGVWAPGDLVRRWADDTGIRVSGGHRLVLQIHYHNHTGQPVLDRTRVGLELATTVAEIGDIHHARNTALYLPPGLARVEASATHEISVDAPTTARGARIHMHQLGTSGRLELIRGDTTRCLVDIPRWDFAWQLFYTFDEAVPLEVGDRVRLTCVYDTRSRTAPVTWGLGTDDEMCIGYTYVTL